jgi:ABC-type sugar transport system permease subunit
MNWKNVEGFMSTICMAKLNTITKDLFEVSQCDEKSLGSRLLKYEFSQLRYLLDVCGTWSGTCLILCVLC